MITAASRHTPAEVEANSALIAKVRASVATSVAAGARARTDPAPVAEPVRPRPDTTSR